MKLTESHFYFVANYSVLSDIFEFSKRVVENFVHFMQFSGRVHISVENRHTVMIQVSADSKFHALQLCFYNASSKIDISTPKQQFRENA